MATGGGEVNSDEIITIKCCFCVKNNRTREAAKYCVECKEYYCIPCTDTHRMFPTLASHKLLDKTDFRSLGSDGNLLSVPTQRCSQHHTEVTNMYCKDHDQVACPPCIALNHRACKDIMFIPEKVDQLYNRSELTDTKQKFHNSKTTMQEMKAANDNKLKELKSMFDKEVQSVKAFRQELQTLLDNLEQETIKELKREFDRIETQLTSEINEANNLIDAINKVSSELKKSEGNKAQEFVSVKFSEKVVTRTDDVQKDHQNESFNFLADQSIKAFLQQIQTLGKITINKTSDCIVGQKDSLYKVIHQREIIVRIPKIDRIYPCRISSLCAIGDGSLLLADLNNKKLKRFDMSTETVNDYLDLQAKPIAVCLVSKTDAAVSLQYNNTVQFVSLGNMLTASRKLKMNHPCDGLAHWDGKLFISSLYQKTVYIYDMNGYELKGISRDTFGQEIFGRSSHITISNEGDKVFVADGIKGVVILDIQGNYISTLTDPSFTETCGVSTDGNNLFVLGNKSNNIVQFSKDYTPLGEVMKVKWPLSICIDPHNSRAYVTSEGCDEITLLELEK